VFVMYWIADVVRTAVVFACLLIGGVFLFVSGVALLVLGSPAGLSEGERHGR